MMLDLENGLRSSSIHHRRATDATSGKVMRTADGNDVRVHCRQLERAITRGKGRPIAASDLAIIHSSLILLN